MKKLTITLYSLIILFFSIFTPTKANADILAWETQGIFKIRCADTSELEEKWQDECYTCIVVAKLIDAFMEGAGMLYDITSEAALKLLIFGFILWVPFWGLKHLGSLAGANGAEMIGELTIMLFKIGVAAILTQAGIGVLVGYTVTPILDAGVDFAQTISDTSDPIEGAATSLSSKETITKETGIVSAELLNKIILLAKTASNKISTIMVIGDAISCFGFEFPLINVPTLGIGPGWLYIPDFMAILVGIALWCVGLFLSYAVCFYLLDVSFKLGFAVLLLPIAIGLWPFPLKDTKGKIGTCIKIAMHSAGTFILLAITTSLAMILLDNAFTTADTDPSQGGINTLFEKINDDDKEYIRNIFDVSEPYIFILLFCMVAAFKIVGKTDDFANKIFKSELGGLSPIHHAATQAVGQATSPFIKMGKIARDVATHQAGKAAQKAVNSSIKSAGNATRAVVSAVRNPKQAAANIKKQVQAIPTNIKRQVQTTAARTANNFNNNKQRVINSAQEFGDSATQAYTSGAKAVHSLKKGDLKSAGKHALKSLKATGKTGLKGIKTVASATGTTARGLNNVATSLEKTAEKIKRADKARRNITQEEAERAKEEAIRTLAEGKRQGGLGGLIKIARGKLQKHIADDKEKAAKDNTLTNASRVMKKTGENLSFDKNEVRTTEQQRDRRREERRRQNTQERERQERENQERERQERERQERENQERERQERERQERERQERERQERERQERERQERERQERERQNQGGGNRREENQRQEQQTTASTHSADSGFRPMRPEDLDRELDDAMAEQDANQETNTPTPENENHQNESNQNDEPRVRASEDEINQAMRELDAIKAEKQKLEAELEALKQGKYTRKDFDKKRSEINKVNQKIENKQKDVEDKKSPKTDKLVALEAQKAQIQQIRKLSPEERKAQGLDNVDISDNKRREINQEIENEKKKIQTSQQVQTNKQQTQGNQDKPNASADDIQAQIKTLSAQEESLKAELAALKNRKASPEEINKKAQALKGVQNKIKETKTANITPDTKKKPITFEQRHGSLEKILKDPNKTITKHHSGGKESYKNEKGEIRITTRDKNNNLTSEIYNKDGVLIRESFQEYKGNGKQITSSDYKYASSKTYNEDGTLNNESYQNENGELVNKLYNKNGTLSAEDIRTVGATKEQLVSRKIYDDNGKLLNETHKNKNGDTITTSYLGNSIQKTVTKKDGSVEHETRDGKTGQLKHVYKTDKNGKTIAEAKAGVDKYEDLEKIKNSFTKTDEDSKIETREELNNLSKEIRKKANALKSKEINLSKKIEKLKKKNGKAEDIAKMEEELKSIAGQIKANNTKLHNTIRVNNNEDLDLYKDGSLKAKREIIDNELRESEYYQDGKKKQNKLTRIDGSSSEVNYDEDGNKTSNKFIEANGDTTETTFNKDGEISGRTITVKDENGNITEIEYNSKLEVVSKTVTKPDGSTEQTYKAETQETAEIPNGKNTDSEEERKQKEENKKRREKEKEKEEEKKKKEKEKKEKEEEEKRKKEEEEKRKKEEEERKRKEVEDRKNSISHKIDASMQQLEGVLKAEEEKLTSLLANTSLSPNVKDTIRKNLETNINKIRDDMKNLDNFQQRVQAQTTSENLTSLDASIPSSSYVTTNTDEANNKG
ncbi:MAG: hypothetical protein R3Y43_08505 [Alphaproteobacteria bacterium]